MSIFDIVLVTDLSIILIDLDQGRTVTNDAIRVIQELDQRARGGIGTRSVYYRDTSNRFDQLLVVDGQFCGFAPCSANQQTTLAGMIA